MPDANAIYAALSAFEGKFVDILTQNAVNTFVYTSLGDITRNLKKGIVLDDLREAGMQNVKKIDKTNVGELKEYLREQSVPFVDSYRADLLNGGRYVNVGQWGAPDKDGVHPYLGYNRKWVPWLDQYNQSQREKISDIIQSGKPKDDIRDDLKKFFSERKNHANTVARTEVGNNAAIIRRDRWVKQGYRKFMWVCSVSTNSPCQVMCSQFCGKVYDVDNLPMNGEKAHTSCKCNLVAVKGSDSDITNGSTTNPMETEGYQVATSSAAGKRLLEQGYKPDEKYPSIIKVPPVTGTKPVTTATTADITTAKPVMKSKVDDITKPQGTAHPVKSFSTGKTVKIAGEPIYREELALASLKKEKVVIFDDAGNLVHSAQGTNTSVDVSKFSNKLTGNIVTHNHPNKDSALDLSDGDLNVAGLYGVKEMRVVCNNKLLTVKRTDGGNITESDAKDMMNFRYNTRMQRMDDMRKEVLGGKMSINECGDKQGDWWLSRYEEFKGDDNHITHEIVDLMGIMR